MAVDNYFNRHRKGSWGWVFDMLAGEAEVTPQYVIGSQCNRKHGQNDKMIRYAKTNKCVICAKQDYEKSAAGSYEKRNMAALRHYEEKMNREEEDPLM